MCPPDPTFDDGISVTQTIGIRNTPSYTHNTLSFTQFVDAPVTHILCNCGVCAQGHAVTQFLCNNVCTYRSAQMVLCINPVCYA